MGSALVSLIIFPLVGGYYIATRSRRYKYLNERLDSQAVLFNSIILGIPLLIGSLTISVGFSYAFPCQVNWIKTHLFPIQNQFFGTCLLSYLIAFFGTRITNKLIERNDAIRSAIRKVGNELELLFSRSCSDSELIQVTLKNSKVYVGWVETLPMPSRCPYVKLIPLFSGFRNEKKELKITTEYSPVYSKYIQTGEIKAIDELEMNLVILVSEIISATRFDFDVFEEFEKIAKTASPPAGFS